MSPKPGRYWAQNCYRPQATTHTHASNSVPAQHRLGPSIHSHGHTDLERAPKQENSSSDKRNQHALARGKDFRPETEKHPHPPLRLFVFGGAAAAAAEEVEEMLSGDIPPNQTIYLNNLNEKVKKEGSSLTRLHAPNSF